MTRSDENPTRARIALAEDDAEMRRLLVDVLSADGHEVTPCADGIELIDHLASALPRRAVDLIVTDARMPGLHGMQLLEDLHERPHAPPVILITAFGSQVTHEHAHRLGCAAVLDKPFELDALRDAIRAALEAGGDGGGRATE